MRGRRRIATGHTRYGIRPQNKHLIAGQEAFAYSLPDESQRSGPDVHQLADKTFDTLAFFDVVKHAPAFQHIYRGRHYNLGRFMSSRLCLRELRQYCLDMHGESKPVNLDEDNAASQYKDSRVGRSHRKRAWTTLLCGCPLRLYRLLSLSLLRDRYAGFATTHTDVDETPVEYIHSVDLVRAIPVTHVVREHPEHTVPSVFGR